jgi:hypothetical protein
MPDFLFHLPLALSGPLLVAALVLVALAGLSAARRWIHPRMSITAEDSEFVGTMVQGVLVFYGLAVALITVSVWENQSQVAQTASEEATSIAVLYRDLSMYPEPLRSSLQGELRGYVRYITTEAWALARQGRAAQGGIPYMERLQAGFGSFRPQTAAEEVIHAEALDAYNRMLHARRMRLDSVQQRLPDVMWMLVQLGGGVALVSTFFFAVRDFRLHATMVSILATFMALVIVLILALDRPYHGELGIGPDSYELVYDQLMK